jgi:sporulation protein YabP
MDEKGPRMSDLRVLEGAPDHTLTVVNREQLAVAGVIAVESFDDEEILLETELGLLTIRGEEMHIKQLDLETGRFAVEGQIHACLYSNPRARQSRGQRGKGFLERLLK